MPALLGVIMKKTFAMLLIVILVSTLFCALPVSAATAKEMTRADYEQYGEVTSMVNSSDKLYYAGALVKIKEDINNSKVTTNVDVYDQVGGEALNKTQTLKAGNIYYFRAKVWTLRSGVRFTDKGSLVFVVNGTDKLTCAKNKNENSWKLDADQDFTLIVPKDIIIDCNGKRYEAGQELKVTNGLTATVWYEGKQEIKSTSATTATTATTIKSVADLKTLGNVKETVGTNGFQIEFTKDWTVQKGCVVSKDGKTLKVGDKVKSGEIATVWYEG